MRLFFALQPDAGLRQALAALAIEVAAAAHGRAVAAANIHLTLAFLGERPDGEVDALGSLVQVLDAQASTLELARVGSFRSSAVAWIAPLAAPPALCALHEALWAALAASGLTRESRPFSPHVTLARKIGAPIARVGPILPWRADRLALMASETSPAGPRYRELAVRTLG